MALTMALGGCLPASGGGGGDDDAAPTAPRDRGPIIGDAAPVVDAGPDARPVDAAPADGSAVDAAPPDAAPPSACANGLDDDGDGRIDLADRGCDGPDDDDEGDEVPLPGCDDGEDNDGDGRIDLADPDCTSAADPREDGVEPGAVCNNGLDDDGDGAIDFPLDPGCAAAGDDTEEDRAQPPACANGEDDDGDGTIDYPLDPGCAGRGDGDETDPFFAPICANGLDDDGDGDIDLDDSGCVDAAGSSELGPCGVETLDLAALGLDHTDTTAGLDSRLVGTCGGAAGGERVFVYTPTEPLERLIFSTDHPETARPTVLYVRRNCAAPADRCDRGTEVTPGVTMAFDDPGPGPYFVVVDTGSPEPGPFRLTVEPVPVAACRNGRDDDEDGLTDAADPGCEVADDRDEADPAEPPVCANGLDDDMDGLTDHPADPDCAFAGGDREAPLCADGVEVIPVPARGGRIELPQLAGNGGAQGSCGAGFTPEAALLIRLDAAADVTVEATVDGEPATTTVFARRACIEPESEVACRASNDPGPLELLEQPPGELFVFVEQAFAAAGAVRIAEVTIVPIIGACNDAADNDGDGRVDLEDPGCTGPRDQSEADPPAQPECDNGVDDDGDGLTDYPEDDGCAAAGDPREGGCDGHPQWRPVECVTPDWVWTSDRRFQTVEAANANRTLWSGCNHTENRQGLCSLDGTGWVSVETQPMAGCNNSWYHIGGRHTGNCGGHDGDTVRRLVLGEDDCYDY